MDRAIRKMNADERQAIAYRHAYEEIEERLRAEYEAEFGEEFRQQYPFKPNGQIIHALAMKQISAGQN